MLLCEQGFRDMVQPPCMRSTCTAHGYWVHVEYMLWLTGWNPVLDYKPYVIPELASFQLLLLS